MLKRIYMGKIYLIYFSVIDFLYSRTYIKYIKSHVSKLYVHIIAF